MYNYIIHLILMKIIVNEKATIVFFFFSYIHECLGRLTIRNIVRDKTAIPFQNREMPPLLKILWMETSAIAIFSTLSLSWTRYLATTMQYTTNEVGL